MITRPNKFKRVQFFLDESGDPNVIGPKGQNLVKLGLSKNYFVLTAVRTLDHKELHKNIIRKRLRMLNSPAFTEIISVSNTLEPFHCFEDHPKVKESVFKFINSLDIKVNVLVVDKRKTHLRNMIARDPDKMYAVMSAELLKPLIHLGEQVEIVFSSRTNKRAAMEEIEKEVEKLRKRYLKKHPRLRPSISVSYSHRRHYTHGGLQVADYISNAVFLAFEKKDLSNFKIIEKKIDSIQDIFNKKHFTQSKPLKLST